MLKEWQPMETAPKDQIIWLYAATDCIDVVRARLARWRIHNMGEEWWEEESDCTIQRPKCWFPVYLPKNPD